MPTRDRTRNPFRRILASLFGRFGRPSPGRSPSPRDPRLRRPRLEPLEDRALLSVSGVLFVDADAVGANTGESWTDAFTDLQDALEAAADVNGEGLTENNVDQIWIAEGTYRPSAELEPGDPRSASFSLVDRVKLYGGFAGTEAKLSERDLSGHTTVLSGDLGVGGDNVDNAYTVVYCGEGVTAAVDGVTVTGGNANGTSNDGHGERRYGGGIFIDGSCVLSEMIVVENVAISGGGVFQAGTLKLSHCEFSDNSAGRGGGVFQKGDLEVAQCTFSGNAAEYGGAIYRDQGTLVVSETLFRQNTAIGGIQSGGGAIYDSSNEAFAVAGSTFRANATNGGGGAIYSRAALHLVDSMLSGNHATTYGGAICLSFLGSYSLHSTITNCVLTENLADYSGGGIHCSGRTTDLTITNCTVAHNSAEVWGGISGDRELTVNNSIFWDNKNGEIEPDRTINWTRSLVGIDPGFVDPDGGNFRLTGDSPAVDLGENSVVDGSRLEDGYPLIEADLDGESRIVGGSVDVGAYESNLEPPTDRESPSTIVTTSDDRFDVYDGMTSLREAIFYASSSPSSTVTFDTALDGQTIALAGTPISIIGQSLTISAASLASLTIDAGGRTSRLRNLRKGGLSRRTESPHRDQRMCAG